MEAIICKKQTDKGVEKKSGTEYPWNVNLPLDLHVLDGDLGLNASNMNLMSWNALDVDILYTYCDTRVHY